MHRLGVAASLTRVVAVGERPVAKKSTTALRANPRKIVRSRSLKVRIRVARAAEAERSSDRTLLLKQFKDPAPHWGIRHRISVADEVEPMLSTT